MSLLTRLAVSAPAPVLIIDGDGARATAWELALAPDIQRVRSPRHATVLLMVGALAAEHAEALQRVHDQAPHPRGAVWFTRRPLPDEAGAILPEAEVVTDDPVATVRRVHRHLLGGQRSSAATIGPESNPTDWRGVGPHGQGGEGMMGGTPYGRRMAMTGHDVRDGLQLDRVPLNVGPLYPALPTGLALDLELQGDVIVTCDAHAVDGPWLATTPTAGGGAEADLLWVAELLRVHGLGSVAERMVRCGLGRGGDRRRLLTRARRRLTPSLRGVGEIEGRDALDRFDARLDGQPWRPEESPVEVLEAHLPGMEWGEAVTTIWSLDPLAAETPAETVAG